MSPSGRGNILQKNDTSHKTNVFKYKVGLLYTHESGDCFGKPRLPSSNSRRNEGNTHWSQFYQKKLYRRKWLVSENGDHWIQMVDTVGDWWTYANRFLAYLLIIHYYKVMKNNRYRFINWFSNEYLTVFDYKKASFLLHKMFHSSCRCSLTKYFIQVTIVLFVFH